MQRKGANSVTYKQNIIVRYLQPPPIPNAGPLVIKEVNSKAYVSRLINSSLHLLDLFATTSSITTTGY